MEAMGQARVLVRTNRIAPVGVSPVGGNLLSQSSIQPISSVAPIQVEADVETIQAYEVQVNRPVVYIPRQSPVAEPALLKVKTLRLSPVIERQAAARMIRTLEPIAVMLPPSLAGEQAPPRIVQLAPSVVFGRQRTGHRKETGGGARGRTLPPERRPVPLRLSGTWLDVCMVHPRLCKNLKRRPEQLRLFSDPVRDDERRRATRATTRSEAAAPQ